MGELDADLGALGVDEIHDPLQRGDVRVRPQAEIAIGNAPLGDDARGLDQDQPEAAQREAAKMHQVPVIGEAVLGRILAHRGHHRPVAEGDAAQREGRKQM